MDCCAAGSEWTDVAQVVAAAGAVMAALAIPLTAYARRPRLDLEEDRERVQTQIEGNGLPWIRMFVSNRPRRRAATGTRAIVTQYLEHGTVRPIGLGSPELGWPSAGATPDGITIFAGGSRPVSLGDLLPLEGKAPDLTLSAMLTPEEIIASGGEWHLHLGFNEGFYILNQREYLPPRPNGYAVRVTVGATDGAARTYDVDVNWNGKAASAKAALNSVQVAIREV